MKVFRSLLVALAVGVVTLSSAQARDSQVRASTQR